jgi:hypothetical protein
MRQCRQFRSSSVIFTRRAALQRTYRQRASMPGDTLSRALSCSSPSPAHVDVSILLKRRRSTSHARGATWGEARSRARINPRAQWRVPVTTILCGASNLVAGVSHEALSDAPDWTVWPRTAAAGDGSCSSQLSSSRGEIMVYSKGGEKYADSSVSGTSNLIAGVSHETLFDALDWTALSLTAVDGARNSSSQLCSFLVRTISVLEEGLLSPMIPALPSRLGAPSGG